MKDKKVKSLFIAIIVIVLSVAIALKIMPTGYTVKEAESTPLKVYEQSNLDSDAYTTESKEIESKPLAVKEYCSDLDGLNYSIKSTVSSSRSGSKTDNCQNGLLIEYYCNDKTKEMKYNRYDCKKEGKVCDDGACKQPKQTQPTQTQFQDIVTCKFTWPQKVVVKGKESTCPLIRPYCNVKMAQKGIAQCCKYYENLKTYYDCKRV